jgi:hypothetical protein
MDSEYEIFECLADGSVMWCDRAIGLRNARLKLDGLPRDTGNEYFAMHLLTRHIIFAADVSRLESGRAIKRIFQIAYTKQLRIERSELLRSLGYPVISVLGNEAAKIFLTTLRRDNLSIALFIVGHAAPAETRKEMVTWIRSNYPRAKILALNPPSQKIEIADYNENQNRPESWLPLVATNISALQPN